MHRIPSRPVITGLSLTGTWTLCLMMEPMRRVSMVTQGSCSIPVVPCTCSSGVPFGTSPRAFTNLAETSEPSAPVSTRKRYGPLPSIQTGTTMRPTRSWWVGAANNMSEGSGFAAGAGGAAAGARAGSSATTQRARSNVFMATPAEASNHHHHTPVLGARSGSYRNHVTVVGYRPALAPQSARFGTFYGARMLLAKFPLD